jgi:hypothetical protein
MAVTIVRTASSSQIGSLLTQASASTTYLTQTSASNTYLTQTSASTTYLTQTSASTTYANKNVNGLNLIIPTSITKGASGSASVSANGLVTFTGTESILLNGVFSSTYQNYKLILNVSSCSLGAAGTTIRYRYASTGTSNSNASYWFNNYGSAAWGDATPASIAGAAVTSGEIGYTVSSGHYTADIINPAVVDYSYMIGSAVGIAETRTRPNLFFATTVFDGIQFFPGSGGTFTGTARMYGYNNGG